MIATGKHTRTGPQRDSRGYLQIWHTTKPLPWHTRPARRAANRRARASRKANRR